MGILDDIVKDARIRASQYSTLKQTGVSDITLSLSEGWSKVALPVKVALVTRVGLKGKVAEKAWADLTADEKRAISKYRFEHDLSWFRLVEGR